MTVDIIALSKYLVHIPGTIRQVAERVIIRQTSITDIADASWLQQAYYPNGNAPDWLSALANGNPEMLDSLTDEVLILLAEEVEKTK